MRILARATLHFFEGTRNCVIAMLLTVVIGIGLAMTNAPSAPSCDYTCKGASE